MFQLIELNIQGTCDMSSTSLFISCSFNLSIKSNLYNAPIKPVFARLFLISAGSLFGGLFILTLDVREFLCYFISG